jgi:hypothetical protein
VGKRQNRDLASRLAVLVMHLLKWGYQLARRSPSWQRTIREQRRQLTRLLRAHPSLRPRLPVFLAGSYPQTRAKALDETGLPATALPQHCSWTVTHILDDEFWPEV